MEGARRKPIADTVEGYFAGGTPALHRNPESRSEELSR
jgi:hypothetical protein